MLPIGERGQFLKNVHIKNCYHLVPNRMANNGIRKYLTNATICNIMVVTFEGGEMNAKACKNKSTRVHLPYHM